MTERPLNVEALLTYDAAGKVLGVTSRTVWTLVDRGDLPAVRFGNSVRIDPVDLRDFIARSKTRPCVDSSESATKGGGR